MSEKEPNISENGELLTEPYDNNVKMTADEVLSLFLRDRSRRRLIIR